MTRLLVSVIITMYQILSIWLDGEDDATQCERRENRGPEDGMDGGCMIE